MKHAAACCMDCRRDLGTPDLNCRPTLPVDDFCRFCCRPTSKEGEALTEQAYLKLAHALTGRSTARSVNRQRALPEHIPL